MRFVLLVFLISALTLVGCGAQHKVDGAALEQSAELGRVIDFRKPDYGALATAIEQITNQVRAQNGLTELKTHKVLRKASATYAAKMVREGFLAHEDPNSTRLKTPHQRVAAAGGANPVTAENIADVPAFQVGNGEPFYVLDEANHVIAREPNGTPIPAHTYASFAATVVEGWMNSPGHRRNLLAPDAIEIGVGAEMYLQNTVPAFVVVQKFQLRETLR